MDTDKINNSISKIEKEIEKMDKKTFKLNFFVFDTKGVANSELEYIYELAMTFKKRGYKVQMLYSEKEFTGVGEWLGEEYAKLPHFNASTANIDISPADFVFIPDAYCSVMSQTKQLPCKRIAIIRSTDYLFDSIPYGVSMRDLNIRDCIVPTEEVAESMKKLFPEIRTFVIHPTIDKSFSKGKETKKMIVNVATKNDIDMATIIKSFYLRYPIYNWVSFRPLKNVSRTDYATALQEAPITIWVDPTTDFGITAIEAMACGSIIIGKVPEKEIEWCFKNGKLTDNALWFYDIKDASDLIVSAIQTYLHRAIHNDIYNAMKKTVAMYTTEAYEESVNDFEQNVIVSRKQEFIVALDAFKNNMVKIIEK